MCPHCAAAAAAALVESTPALRHLADQVRATSGARRARVLVGFAVLALAAGTYLIAGSVL